MKIYSHITTKVPDQFVVRTQTTLQSCAHMYVYLMIDWWICMPRRDIHMMIYSPITTKVPDQFVVRTQTTLQSCTHMYVSF